jgi:NADH:ubiquinone oxidoreductase subunit 2 (subunit N)
VLGLAAVVNTSGVDVATLSMNGLNGMLIYLMGYLFTNIGAFMVAMAVENMSGGSDYSRLYRTGQAGFLAGHLDVCLLAQLGRESR